MTRMRTASSGFRTKPLQWHSSSKAAGVASDGKNRILTIQPKELHQRTPVFMGSPDDVADVLRFANA